MRPPREAGQPRLLPMGDLLGDQQRQEVAIRPGVALRAQHKIAPHASGIGEMQPFEERVQIVIGRDHDRPARGSRVTAIVGGRSAAGSTGRPTLASPVRVRDVLGADRLFGEAALEGSEEGRIAVALQQVVPPLDIVTPRPRAAMRELGEIGQGGRAEIE